MQSCAAIVPANLRDAFNERAELAGKGPNNYSVPLSPTGDEPATHYGLHAWIEDDAVIEDMDGRIISVRADVAGHFAEVCEGMGLTVVTPPEP